MGRKKLPTTYADVRAIFDAAGEMPSVIEGDIQVARGYLNGEVAVGMVNRNWGWEALVGFRPERRRLMASQVDRAMLGAMRRLVPDVALRSRQKRVMVRCNGCGEWLFVTGSTGALAGDGSVVNCSFCRATPAVRHMMGIVREVLFRKGACSDGIMQAMEVMAESLARTDEAPTLNEAHYFTAENLAHVVRRHRSWVRRVMPLLPDAWQEFIEDAWAWY